MSFLTRSGAYFLTAVSLGRGTNELLLSYIEFSEANGSEPSPVGSLSRTERARHGRAGAGPALR